MNLNYLPRAALLAVLGANLTLGATGWHGDGTGRYPDATPPLTWSRDEKVAWRVPIPRWSNACPVVQDDRVLVCSEPSTILCYALADGKLLWQAEQDYADVAPDAAAAEAARAARQALEDLEPKLAAAERAVRNAKDTLKKAPDDEDTQKSVADAEQQRDALRKTLEPHARYRYPARHDVNGLTSPTPVADGSRFYVLFGSGTLAAYTLDGQRVWGRETVRPKHGWGHSASPRLADGMLLVHIGDRLLGIDAATGEDRWQAGSASGWGTPAVAQAGERWIVITPAGDWFDAADGRKIAEGVQRFDWNGPMVFDGVVYQMDEKGASAVAINPDGTPRPLWKANVPKNRYYATAVVEDGRLYNIHQGGRLTVLSTADGSVVYQQELPFGGKKTVYPSPVVAGGRIYASADNGLTVVLESGNTYNELAINILNPFRATPVFTGNRVLIRTLTDLTCFE